ncbi:hypothetical protein [Asticcacaulis excentricus]|nr:hypothetical protein [Asticcacaulis excentricus]
MTMTLAQWLTPKAQTAEFEVMPGSIGRWRADAMAGRWCLWEMAAL